MRRPAGFTALALILVFLLAACSVHGADPRAPAGPGSAHLEPGHVRMGDGEPLRLRRFGPEQAPDAVVLALHGLNDRAEAFVSLGETLADHDIALYAYDQRSFGASAYQGRWPGEATLVEDNLAILAALRERYPHRPLYLAGESMGAAVAILAAAHAPDAADRLILLSPATWARRTQPWYQRLALWLAVRLIPERTFTGESLGIRPTDNEAELRALGRDPLFIKETRVATLYGATNLMDHALERAAQLQTPTLLLYGAHDEIIPPEAICALIRQLPPTLDWHFAWYPDGWHMLTRDLSGERVRTDLAAWIHDPGAALPSNALRPADEAVHRLCPR
ncbi:alpha/beta fold hydrolase [Alkalilimnicola ehrlichii MLHE-1]|uniref:Alpha/beta hydrolase fold protein n=1 Tax=Alkalilimnicola ehrlichii (strain ATCC BAA-1101 / DSM 17681 / MLHE-1) TaxID=187272 RepID=Q0A8J5_ALKEH|nr:alpha/beta fold hydrolase [Alkalilimnicola ehrlichii]ABI56842.1 alpha/beta hydrolase fold protein [Alkalilimnicola ehrlichii MLHE-1]